MEAGASERRGGRSDPRAVAAAPALPDPLLQWGLSALAALILALIAFFFVPCTTRRSPRSTSSASSFLFNNDWDPSKDIFGAWPLVVGTLITSALALVIGVPIAVAAALYITELVPARRAPRR